MTDTMFAFLDWLMNDYMPIVQEWADNALRHIIRAMQAVAFVVIVVTVAVVTLPLWIIPFIYWYFFERGKH